MTVYFDEAGNTGHDLLNEAQPIYILCSTDVGEQESRDLLSANFSNPDGLHFKSRRKTSRGQRELISFAAKHLLNLNARFKSIVIHKEYMVTCQMLNYLVEP